ncbi:MAG: ferritin-like domain-containing protein [bacterium]|nr:ferritin-like domain-containing protein [bacterium]MCP5068342.1 ferritin-like domain-containing protein [bacterium]
MSNPLPETQPFDGETVDVALTAIYNWNYDSELDQLRSLYVNALDRQWNAMRDFDWEIEVDRESFTKNFSFAGMPLYKTDFWQGLPKETQWEVSRRSTAFMLSNFLHGEQGALIAASELVNAVPDIDGKLYAATQTLDEARHVEVFGAYIKKLDQVYPIAPGLKQLLNNIVQAGDWKTKALGMNIVVEGLALYVFREMRNATQEPLLKGILTNVARDEARHTAFGIRYLGKVVPTLSDQEKAELEDFAFEIARLLIDSRGGTSIRESALTIWREAGVDPAEAVAAIAKDRDKIREHIADQGGRMGPLSGFVLPTLREIGLFSDRIRDCFEDVLVRNNGEQAKGLVDRMVDLPEDLEAWALAEV